MSASGKVRILIVDDHAVFRDALATLLAAVPEFEVAGTCGSVEEALSVVMARPIDAVLLDLKLAGTRGSAFCPIARELGFKGKIFVLTGKVESDEAVRLLADGASGVFLKQTSPGLLAPAIRQVMAGQIWIDPALLPEGRASPETDSMRNLTHRERRVLMGVFDGLTNKEIAARLNTSEESVKSSVRQLFAKLGVRTRVQLVRKMMNLIAKGRSATG